MNETYIGKLLLGVTFWRRINLKDMQTASKSWNTTKNKQKYLKCTDFNIKFKQSHQGACTNHVDKRGGGRVVQMTTTLNNSYLVKVSAQGEGGQNYPEFCPRGLMYRVRQQNCPPPTTQLCSEGRTILLSHPVHSPYEKKPGLMRYQFLFSI